MQASGADGLLRPDERLETFVALLHAPAASSAHLRLLDDNTLYGSLAFYLSSLHDTQHVARLAHAVANSGAFWASPPPRAVTAGSSLIVARALNLSRAVAQATTRRLDLLLRARRGASGWRTQRVFAQWVNTVAQAAESDELLALATGHSQGDDATGAALLGAWFAAGADPSLAGLYGTPLPRLAILTGLLLGLHAVQEERSGGARPSRGMRLGKLKRELETAWLNTLAQSTETIQRCLSPTSYDPNAASEPSLVPASGTEGPNDTETENAWEKEFVRRQLQLEPSPYPSEWTLAARRTVWEPTLLLAGELGQYLHESRVRALVPASAFIQVASDALIGLYEQYNLPHCIKQSSDDIVWSTSQIEALHKDRLYPWIGPLSRLTSYALAQSVLDSTPTEAQELLLGQGNVIPSVLARVETLSKGVGDAWRSSKLAGPKEELSPSLAQLKEHIYTELRRLVFSSTMLFDALTESLVDMVPSPTETVPLSLLESESLQVDVPASWRAESASNIPKPYLSFVRTCLLTYGHLYFVVNLYGQDTLTAYKRVFYSSLDLLGRDPQASVAFLVRVDPRKLDIPGQFSPTIFYLDVAEQLCPALPDAMVEQAVLPLCRPFIESNALSADAFESAHSCVLATFSSRKQVCQPLAAYYVPLLLQLYPSSLSTEQFQLAFSVLVDTISSKDDAEAWWALSKLHEKVDRARAQRGLGSFSSSPNSAEFSDSANKADTLQILQVTYAAQLAHINLVLIRRVLCVVQDWIFECRPGAPLGLETQGQREERHHSLCQSVWDAMGHMDASGQEEAFQWWTANRAAFGVPLTKL